MSAQDRIREKLMKEKKRRDRQPAANMDLMVKCTISPARRDEFTRQSPGVLLAIERCIHKMWQDHEQLDDRYVIEALEAEIRHQPAADPIVNDLLQRLKTVYQALFGSEQDRKTWVTGLRCVYTSVRNNSSCRRGDVDYLKTAAAFLAKAGKF